jgi:hypothetical protein
MPFVWDACNYSTYPTHKREDSFFAYMDLSNNHCYSITGTDLGTTITKAESLSHCLAYASGDNSLSGTTLYFDYATFTPYMTTVVENGSVADYIFFTYDGGWTDPQVVTSTPFWMGRDAMQMVSGHLQMFLQISMASGDRGGRIEQWELDGGVWTGVGIIADKFQATPGSYFADPVKIVGLENDWIFFGESKEDDFATELRVFAYNVSAGFLVNGTHVASPEPEPGTWAPAFTSTPVTTGKVGVLYSYAAGCNESVTWVLSADEFLSISAGGVVSGTPDHAGTYLIGIKATSVAGSNSTWQNYTLTVSEPSSGGTDPYDIPGGGGPDLDHPDWAKRIAGFAVILLIAIMIAAGVKMATSRRKGGRGGRRRR